MDCARQKGVQDYSEQPGWTDRQTGDRLHELQGRVRMRPYTPKTFWERVRCPGVGDSCWPWEGGKGRGGYGKVTYQGRTWSTHRLAWALTYGPIPTGKQINHSCDNRPCCNPSHLHAGTQKENIGEAMLRGRMATGDRQAYRVHPESRPYGEKNGSAKLTAEQVRSIRQRVDSSYLVASEYGVSASLIQQIRSRKAWRHLD